MVYAPPKVVNAAAKAAAVANSSDDAEAADVEMAAADAKEKQVTLGGGSWLVLIASRFS
jgi:hypothetical protein